MQVVFHVGLFKTGTTTLQNGYFSQHPEFLSLGRPFKENEIELWIKDLRQQDSTNFNAETPDCVKSAMQSAKQKYLIISDEGLTSHGGADRLIIAQRLHDVSPNAKILIVVREQSDLLISYYYHQSKGSKHISFKDFNDWFEYCRGYLNVEILSTLNFYNLYRAYAETFGADSVRVLAYEDLKLNATAFYSSIDAWLGVPKRELDTSLKLNPRASERHHIYNRLRKHLPQNMRLRSLVPNFVSTVFDAYLNRGKTKKITYTEAQIGFLRETYAHQNTMLAKATGLELAKHGYMMEET